MNRGGPLLLVLAAATPLATSRVFVTDAATYTSRIVLIIAAVLLIAGPARADTIRVPVLLDATAKSDDAFTSIDSAPENLNVDRFVNGEQRAALEFDISDLPPDGQHIVSASLSLYFQNSDLLVGVHGMAGNGSIENADFTFNNEIATFDPDSITPPLPTENVIDVTSFIQNAAEDHDFVVFQLRELAIDSNTIIGSGSPDSEFHPRLDIVTAVTVPALNQWLTWLLSFSLMGAALLRFRRRQENA